VLPGDTFGTETTYRTVRQQEIGRTPEELVHAEWNDVHMQATTAGRREILRARAEVAVELRGSERG